MTNTLTWPGQRQTLCWPRSAPGTLASTPRAEETTLPRVPRADGRRAQPMNARERGVAGLRPRGQGGTSGSSSWRSFWPPGCLRRRLASPRSSEPPARAAMEEAPEGRSPLRGGEAAGWRVVAVAGDPGLPGPHPPLRPQSPMAAAALRFPAEVSAAPGRPGGRGRSGTPGPGMRRDRPGPGRGPGGRVRAGGRAAGPAPCPPAAEGAARGAGAAMEQKRDVVSDAVLGVPSPRTARERGRRCGRGGGRRPGTPDPGPRTYWQPRRPRCPGLQPAPGDPEVKGRRSRVDTRVGTPPTSPPPGVRAGSPVRGAGRPGGSRAVLLCLHRFPVCLCLRLPL